MAKVLVLVVIVSSIVLFGRKRKTDTGAMILTEEEKELIVLRPEKSKAATYAEAVSPGWIMSFFMFLFAVTIADDEKDTASVDISFSESTPITTTGSSGPSKPGADKDRV